MQGTGSFAYRCRREQVNTVTRLPFLLLLCLLGVTSAWAEPVRYVSDQLVITLRTGQGNQYQILKTLPSGTRLEVLQEGDKGYTQVRAPDGQVGWVLSQYLIDTPIAKQQLTTAEKQLNSLREEASQNKQQLSQLTEERDTLDAQVKQLTHTNETQARELARLKEVSATPLRLDAENKSLKEKMISLERNLQVITQENQALKDQAEREWFMAGAGVLFVGMLLGLIIPRLRTRKKTGWDL